MKGGNEKGYPPFLTRKTLRRKLYMRNITPDQTKTNNCWLLGSAMRGTLTAREMAANDRTPSGTRLAHNFHDIVGKRQAHTHGSNDLGLHAELVLKATGKVADTTLTIASNVGNLADVVEHVAASEEQDGDKADGSPEVPVPDHGEDVGPGHVGQAYGAGEEGACSEPLDPVDGALKGRVWAVGGMAGDPVIDLLGGLGTVGEVVPQRLRRGGGMRTNGGWEEEKDGRRLKAELQRGDMQSVLRHSSSL
jgi:hypothetical protein